MLDPKAHQELQVEAAILDELDANLERCFNAIIARKEGRRRIALEELVDCADMKPEFEHRFTIGYKLRQKHPWLRLPEHYWFYTITGLVGRELVIGGLIGNDMIVVEAVLRERADKLAAEGLAHTLEIARDMKHGLLALPGVTLEDPFDSLEQVAAGRRARVGAPMRLDIAQKVARMMNDRAKVFAQKGPQTQAGKERK